ncbi:uncharacterized protein [Leptinotarsa decemlineata]|uniref:uncharacterized protein n=1 Tax=Leptinotarsa decemlineata TaxID=7539 RepID=UPI003D309824
MADKGKKKRIRAVNFTPREQNLLFSICLNYKNVIENKETNAVVNSEKNETWTKICQEFNSTSGDFNNRSVDQLKRCYENRRQNVRKRRAEVRQECLKTGGGPPPPDIEEKLVLATMDPLTVDGYLNPFDSDSVTSVGSPRKQNQIEYVFENLEQESEVEIQDQEYEKIQIRDSQQDQSQKSEEIETIKYNWETYNVNDLKRPLNPVLLEKMEVKKAKHEPRRDIIVMESKEDEKDVPVRSRIDAERGRGMNRRGHRRRPTATVVRSLASSSLAQKYNDLADKKDIIANHVIHKLERERLHAEKEHDLKMKSLALDIKIKEKQLGKMSI